MKHQSRDNQIINTLIICLLIADFLCVQMTENDFLTFLHTRGIDFLALYEGGSMVDITSLGTFIGVVSGVAVNVTRMVNSKVPRSSL